MRRLQTIKIAALTSLLLLTGSAACTHGGPVSLQGSVAAPLPAATASPAPGNAPAPSAAPTDTPIPASAFAETYFARAGDPPETLVYDSEHGHWEHRSTTLDVRIDCITTDLGRGTVTYFLVNVHVQGGEDAQHIAAASGGESPWRLARENRAVLLLSGNAAAPAEQNIPLVTDGEAVPGLTHAPGRGIDARCSIGAVSDGHYLAIVADGRQPGYSVGLTLAELAGVFVEHGAWSAVNLSSGREAALVFMGEHLNRHAGRYAGNDPSYQARIHDALFFGTSARVPKVTDTIEHDGNG